MFYKGVFLFSLVFSYCSVVDSACTFPLELQNATWRSSWTSSSTSSTLTFTTSNVTISLITDYPKYSCYFTDGGNKYVLQMPDRLIAGGEYYYRYICLDFRRQNAYSYLFYILSYNGYYYKPIGEYYSDTVAEACKETKGAGEYYVIIKKASETFAQQTCTTPLLGVFYFYQRSTSSGQVCASGTWDICNSNSTQISLNRTYSTGCTANTGQLNAAVTTGYIMCVASVTGTYYHQTLYSASEDKFSCLTMGDNGTNILVTQVASSCESSQTPNVSLSGSFFTLVANATCANSPMSPRSAVATNTGLIAGVVVGIVILVAIVGAVLLYKCYWIPKKKSSIKKFTENRREKFQDPDLEEKDGKSAITRQGVIIDFEEEDLTKPISSGSEPDSETKVVNGHAVTLRNGHAPDGDEDVKVATSISPYLEDPVPEEDSSSVNKKPGKFKAYDLDEEPLSKVPKTSEVEDEDKSPVSITTKTTNIYVNMTSATDSLPPVSGEI